MDDGTLLGLAGAGTGSAGILIALLRGSIGRNVQNNDAQLAALSADVAALRGEVKEVLLELRTAGAQHDALKDRVQKVEASAASAHRQLASAHRQIDSLKRSNG